MAGQSYTDSHLPACEPERDRAVRLGATGPSQLHQIGGVAMSKAQRDEAPSNRLLDALEPVSRQRIDPHLEPVDLKLGAIVCDAGGPLKHAYFPQSAVLSLLTVLEDGSAIETANIGREGAFGVFAAMYSRVSFNRCMVQLEGRMVRCPIELLQAEFRCSEHARNLFVSYSETQLSQVQQTVACNAMHTTEQKVCRWFLMMHDRAEGDVLTYTHDFLAQMLGANRKSVTLAAQSMQAAGIISYLRGRIVILDRPGLEKASCECYAIVRERFDAFLTPPPTAVQGHTEGRRRNDQPVRH
jgi:CRP-like cAMP-binding protein